MASRTKAWLVSRSGPLAGTRYLLPDGCTRIGRSPENEVVIQGPSAATVSAQHVEISKDGDHWRIRDTGSTNGTYLNGEKIADAELCAQAIIQLGNDGPEFAFLMEESAPSELERTLVIPRGIVPTQLRAAQAAHPESHEALLSEAVKRARLARIQGLGGQTMTLMRDVVHQALARSSRRFMVVIYALAAILLLTSAYGYWKIRALKAEKASIDRRIEQIETRLAEGQATPGERDRLIALLDVYQGQAETLQHNLLYRMGGSYKETFVTEQIHALMSEFGAEEYSIPPEFIERVNFYIRRYQGVDRLKMERAFGADASKIAIMRQMLEEEKLPPDFAYVPLVESAFAVRPNSAAGAAGPWQFTAVTARLYGLRVDGAVDQRYDLGDSTRAACHFLRDLILDFGAGSSVMLALAAYNLGPTGVKQAIMKSVRDPIKQRNFWYLYRVRALPAETREYVPKVFAAIIIARNPQHFGF
ncbi:MAG: FHA domain-containing protein [Bryobacteraceae bacterium]